MIAECILVGFQLECPIEIREREVRLPVSPVRLPALVEVAWLGGVKLARAGEIGDGVLEVAPGGEGIAAATEPGCIRRLILHRAGTWRRRGMRAADRS